MIIIFAWKIGHKTYFHKQNGQAGTGAHAPPKFGCLFNNFLWKLLFRRLSVPLQLATWFVNASYTRLIYNTITYLVCIIHIAYVYRNNTGDNKLNYLNYGFSEPGEVSIFKKMKSGTNIISNFFPKKLPIYLCRIYICVWKLFFIFSQKSCHCVICDHNSINWRGTWSCL